MKFSFGLILVLISLPLAAETTTYRVLVGGSDVGHMVVSQGDNQLAIDFDFKQNGRGPTMVEEITLDERGYPVDWTITGTTTFGDSVDEYFRVEAGTARWQDTTGTGEARVDDESLLYVDQNGSPYSLALLARALLNESNGRINVYPSGEVSIRTRSTMPLDGTDGQLKVTAYEVLGLSLNPSLVFLDQTGEFFAIASPRFSVIREGYETADESLRLYSEELSTERFVEIQARVAHEFATPVRIQNVRVFDPEALALTDFKDVVVYGNRIASVQPENTPSTDGEVIIDGNGGSLVPGMYEMHGHIGQGNALLNIAAGVTSVRDMGNENDVLDEFFRTGIYRPRTTNETKHTSSPSMDISKASNFERFIFDLTGRDADKVAKLWSAVDKGQAFDLSATPLFEKIKATLTSRFNLS